MNNIVFITDENYIIPTKTAINSIVKNTSNSKIIVNIIAVDISDARIKALLALQTDNIRINILPFDNKFAELGLNHLYVSKAALFKFYLPELFPELDTLLYADGDMIFYPGFEKIFDFDISDYYVAAVQDMVATVVERWAEKIGNDKYFNSGIMYINLKKWREDLISIKLVDYKKNDLDSHFMDQNALNKIIGKKVLWISPEFNLMASCSVEFFEEFYKDGKALEHISSFYDIPLPKMNSIMRHPLILHVTGPNKAWKNIFAERIDEWMPYVLPEDSLVLARNYCLTMSKDYLQMKETIKRQDKIIATMRGKDSNYSYTLGEIISFASGGNANYYILSGFSDCEYWGCWTESKKAEMKFVIHQIKKDLILDINYYDVFRKQHILVYANDTIIDEYDAIIGNKKTTIPKNIIQGDELLLKFEIPTAISPRKCGLSADNRLLGLGFKTMTIN